MSRIYKKIHLYIIKSFLIKFFSVLASIALLIFIINLVDVFDRLGKEEESFAWFLPMQMAMLQIPAFLEDVSMFIILLAAMITLLALSSKSEITIMRSSGLSLWHILSPLMITSFVLGIFFITVFNPITIYSNKKYGDLEKHIMKQEESTIFEVEGGIWLKQSNLLKPEEDIVIRAKTIDKARVELINVNIWFFDDNGEFYKKIDAKNMILNQKFWNLEDVVINDNFSINQDVKTLKILTNLDPEFIVKKVINNFEDVRSFSIFELPTMIRDMEEAGFLSRKFKVYFYSLINKPLMFVSMILMAAYFAINHIRNKNNIIYVVIGIIGGLILYVGSSIIIAFGSSGIIPPFASTWVMTVILLTATILMIFKKEKI